MSTVVSNLRFARYYVRANLSMAMEYRGSFLTQVFGMVLNNTLCGLLGGYSSRTSQGLRAGPIPNCCCSML